MRVLELGQLIAGPFAGQLLGCVAVFSSLCYFHSCDVRAQVRQIGGWLCRHFGAEIIKVEPPRSGDPLRVWRELDVDGTSPWFRSLARNKKSITIDMRKEEGRACVFKSICCASFSNNVKLNTFTDLCDGLRSVRTLWLRISSLGVRIQLISLMILANLRLSSHSSPLQRWKNGVSVPTHYARPIPG